MRPASLNREQWLFCVQLCLAMMLAYFATHGGDPSNAIYAVLGAGLATAPSFGEGLGVSKERIIGTLLGALVSLSAMWLHDRTLALGVTAVLVAPLALMIGGIAVARIAVTVAAVTVLLHTETADVYGFLRFTNTVAGVAVALAVAFLMWPLSRQLSFTLTLRSAVAAAALLAEQLADGDLRAFPLEGQRKLFMALSALPKSLSHIRQDPLLFRQREHARQEALLVAKAGIALLAASLALGRGHNAMPDTDLAAVRACCRHLAMRLHRIRHQLAGSRVLPACPPAPTLIMQDGQAASAPLAYLTVELGAIESVLVELEALLEDYSAASLLPNRLRAKRG
jgi:uncharacterized membrane protein YccC